MVLYAKNTATAEVFIAAKVQYAKKKTISQKSFQFTRVYSFIHTSYSVIISFERLFVFFIDLHSYTYCYKTLLMNRYIAQVWRVKTVRYLQFAVITVYLDIWLILLFSKYDVSLTHHKWVPNSYIIIQVIKQVKNII